MTIFALASANAAGQHMDIEDLSLDMESLNERVVSISGVLVSGRINPTLEALMMKGAAEKYLSSSVKISTSNLPREIRKRILTNCSDQFCKATVTGRVGEVGFGKGIIATELIFHK